MGVREGQGTAFESPPPPPPPPPPRSSVEAWALSNQQSISEFERKFSERLRSSSLCECDYRAESECLEQEVRWLSPSSLSVFVGNMSPFPPRTRSVARG
jgi:hypothetical protein